MFHYSDLSKQMDIALGPLRLIKAILDAKAKYNTWYADHDKINMHRRYTAHAEHDKQVIHIVEYMLKDKWTSRLDKDAIAQADANYHAVRWPIFDIIWSLPFFVKRNVPVNVNKKINYSANSG